MLIKILENIMESEIQEFININNIEVVAKILVVQLQSFLVRLMLLICSFYLPLLNIFVWMKEGAVSMIKSYLERRAWFVCAGGNYFRQATGVPQGSTLRPLLFTIYMIYSVISHANAPIDLDHNLPIGTRMCLQLHHQGTEFKSRM